MPTSVEAQATLSTVRRSLRVLVAATVVLYIAMATITGVGLHTAATVNDSLCTFRQDLNDRVEQSRTFLEEHPNGTPGIPAETIQQGIDNQLRTIDALNTLSC